MTIEQIGLVVIAILAIGLILKFIKGIVKFAIVAAIVAAILYFVL